MKGGLGKYLIRCQQDHQEYDSELSERIFHFKLLVFITAATDVVLVTFVLLIWIYFTGIILLIHGQGDHFTGILNGHDDHFSLFFFNFSFYQMNYCYLQFLINRV